MNRHTKILRRSVPIAVALFPFMLHAQQEQNAFLVEPAVTPLGVVVGLKGGGVMSTARGRFPSLIIGDSKEGSGEIPASLAGTGTGNRFDFALFIPFIERVGLDLQFGTMHYVTSYAGDSSHLPTRFEAQTMQVVIGAQGNLLSDLYAFRTTGLRTIYLGGGLDIGLSTPANRVEGASFPDSTLPAVVTAGSFENAVPFRTLVAIRGSLGLRFGVTTHIELQAEAAYSHALNGIFSEDVVRDNDFTVDNLAFQAGIGYRF